MLNTHDHLTTLLNGIYPINKENDTFISPPLTAKDAFQQQNSRKEASLYV